MYAEFLFSLYLVHHKCRQIFLPFTILGCMAMLSLWTPDLTKNMSDHNNCEV